MGDLTENISRSELACQCGCGFDTCDFELVNVIQEAVNYFKKKYSSDKVCILFKSGNRCKKHNAAIGGADKSQHIKAKASDIKIKVMISGELVLVSEFELYEYFDKKYSNTFGLGIYPRGRVHIDVRKNKARWNKL